MTDVENMTPGEFKIFENRLRRMALRQGLRLTKSSRRDPRAIDYGGYMLSDIETEVVVFGGSPIAFFASVTDIENYLTGEYEEDEE